MLSKVKGEDLFVMAMPDLEVHHRISVEFSRLNGIRDKLRENGIIYDLGQRELESLRYDFPQNVEIESSEIHLTYSRPLGEFVKMRLKSYSKDVVEMMHEMWEEGK